MKPGNRAAAGCGLFGGACAPCFGERGGRLSARCEAPVCGRLILWFYRSRPRCKA